MPRINVKTPFPFSPDGKSVVEIEAGEQEVSDRCAEVAVEHLKLATRLEAPAAPQDEAPADEPDPAQDEAPADEPDPAQDEAPAEEAPAARKSRGAKRATGGGDA